MNDDQDGRKKPKSKSAPIPKTIKEPSKKMRFANMTEEQLKTIEEMFLELARLSNTGRGRTLH